MKFNKKPSEYFYKSINDGTDTDKFKLDVSKRFEFGFNRLDNRFIDKEELKTEINKILNVIEQIRIEDINKKKYKAEKLFTKYSIPYLSGHENAFKKMLEMIK
jgi:hypothetical protein